MKGLNSKFSGDQGSKIKKLHFSEFMSSKLGSITLNDIVK